VRCLKTPVAPESVAIRVGPDAFEASLEVGDPSSSRKFESELVAAGVPIPLPNRVAWAESCPETEFWYLQLRNQDGRAEAGALVSFQGTRALPGWRIARAGRVGPARSDAGRLALLTALARIPDLAPRVLRVHVRVVSVDPGVLAASTDHLASLGFLVERFPSNYLETLTLDLTPSEEEVFAGLHRTARRHIRAVDKRAVEIREVEDPAMAPRLEALTRETFARTGADPPAHDWDSLIRLSVAEPKLSRLVGLFRQGIFDPSGLLAFAWGCFHGDHAHYASAASTRRTDFKGPLVYGLMWDLIVWAKSTGASFFDLGGFPHEVRGPGDPLYGIARFKTCFAQGAQVVGAEMYLEPHPFLGRASRVMGSLARVARRWARKARTGASAEAGSGASAEAGSGASAEAGASAP